MLLVAALFFGCSSAPSGPPSSVAVVSAALVGDELAVEWGLFQQNGANTLANGDVVLSVVERDVAKAPGPTDPAACSVKLPVSTTSFRSANAWSVASSLPLTGDCAIVSTDATRWRVLRVEFTGDAGTFSAETDPPEALRTPTDRERAARGFRKYVDGETESLSPLAAEAAPRVAAYVASWAALAPIVPATAEAARTCPERGRAIPLVEYDDIQSAAGTFDTAAQRRLQPPGFLAQLAGYPEPMSEADTVFAGRMLDESIDRVWVRRSVSFTDGAELSPSVGDKIEVGYTGILALVGRIPPRLLCAASMSAQQVRPAARGTATEAEKTAFVEAVATTVNTLAFQAAHEARQQMTGDELPFQEHEGRVRDEKAPGAPK